MIPPRMHLPPLRPASDARPDGKARRAERAYRGMPEGVRRVLWQMGGDLPASEWAARLGVSAMDVAMVVEWIGQQSKPATEAA